MHCNVTIGIISNLNIELNSAYIHASVDKDISKHDVFVRAPHEGVSNRSKLLRLWFKRRLLQG